MSSTPIFLHDWAKDGISQMLSDFEITAQDLSGAEIILASYSRDNYEGAAFVLFSRDGKLYEVNATHCSCYGLEGKWESEGTTVEALRHRLDRGSLGDDDYTGNVFAAELRAALDCLGCAE